MATEFSWETYWRDLLDQNGAATPGWVALVMFPPALPLEGLVTLYQALAPLVGDEGEKPYRHLLHIAPASLKDELDGQIGSIAAQVSTKVPPITLETTASSADMLVERMVAMPKRTVVVIQSLELFHGRDSSRNTPAIATWSGTGVVLATIDERQGAQIGATIERLLPLAETRELLVVAHTGLSSGAAAAFPPALHVAQNFAMSGGSRVEDHDNTFLSHLLAQMNAGTLSLESARVRARGAWPEPELRAQAEAQLLFARQQFDEAWGVLEPHLDAYENASAAQYLFVARAAHAAFHHEIARDWLRRGAAAAPRSFFELHSAWLLARELDDAPIAESVFAMLSTFFPDEPEVLHEQAKRSLRVFRYAEAANYARRAGLHFYAAVWDGFTSGEFDLDELLRLARHDEDRAYIHLRAALDAEHRGDIENTVWYAKRIPEGSEFSDQALTLRLRMFGNGLLYQNQVNDEDLDELMPLLTAVGTAPKQRKARLALEELVEETLGQFLARSLLGTACERLLIATLPAAYSAPRAILFPFSGDGMEDLEEANTFSKELCATAVADVLMIGHGELPAVMKPRATPQVARALIFITQKIASEDFDLKFATLRLWEIELVCRALGDPSKDGLVAIQLVRGLVRQGANQDARDFAEGALRVLPYTQHVHRPWRTGSVHIFNTQESGEVAGTAYFEALGDPGAGHRCGGAKFAGDADLDRVALGGLLQRSFGPASCLQPGAQQAFG